VEARSVQDKASPGLLESYIALQKKLEVAVGLEPTKIGFAGQRLDHFGIATSGETLLKP
jgi:hypothetical protein